MMDVKGGIKQRTVIVIDDSDDEGIGSFRARSANKRPIRDDDIFSWTEKKPKVEKQERRKSMGEQNDDCELLTKRPGEQAIPMNHDDDDDADLLVTGARGDGAALRDFAHSRHLCLVEPFHKQRSPQNARCCKQVRRFAFICLLASKTHGSRSTSG
jgi:hypothetical protein